MNLTLETRPILVSALEKHDNSLVRSNGNADPAKARRAAEVRKNLASELQRRGGISISVLISCDLEEFDLKAREELAAAHLSNASETLAWLREFAILNGREFAGGGVETALARAEAYVKRFLKDGEKQ